MRDALRAADFTTVSILDDPKLRAEFRHFQRYCDLVSSPNVDAADIFTASMRPLPMPTMWATA